MDDGCKSRMLCGDENLRWDACDWTLFGNWCTDRFQWDGVDATDGGEKKRGTGETAGYIVFFASEKVNAQL